MSGDTHPAQSYLLLTPNELQQIRAKIEQLGVVTPGHLSATSAASLAKNNSEITYDTPEASLLLDEISSKIQSNKQFVESNFLLLISDLLVSRYTVGDKYGAHVDNPQMRFGASDISFTLFLSEIHEYDGGELVLHTQSGSISFKCEPGTAIVYPSTWLHEVTEVTRGQRLAVVGWISSRIPHAETRAALNSLRRLAEEAEKDHGLREMSLSLLQQYANLSRFLFER